jgi:hypothetical protein
MKMTPANTSTPNARTAIRRAVRAGAVVITRHARDRIHQHRIDRDDIEAALATGVVVADRTESENWLVVGDVTVAVALYSDPQVVVLTVMH